MLGRLIKYEWKATKRTFLPLYIAMILVAIVNGIFIRFNDFNVESWLSQGAVLSGVGNVFEHIFPIIQGFIIVMYVGIIIGTIFISIFVMLQRYYKNILGQEGYLMNTLPVKSWQLILSKGIISAIWIVCSALIAMISIPIMFSIVDSKFLLGLVLELFEWDTWSRINQSIGTINLLCYGIELLVTSLCASWAFSMKAYASMSLGHLVQKHRLLGSVGFYIAIDFAESVAGVILMFLIGSVFGEAFTRFFESFDLYRALGTIHVILIGSSVVYLIVAMIYFMISKVILEKKLNLE